MINFLSAVLFIITAATPLSAEAYSLEQMASKAIVTAFNNAHSSIKQERSSSNQTGRMTVKQGAQNLDCAGMQAYGAPAALDERITTRSYFTCRIGYAGMYDPLTKAPRWSAERLDKTKIEGVANRKGVNFTEDPQIPSSANLRLDDFTRSGMDRGHLIPASDLKYSQEAMNQTFLLTNIVAQNSNQNRGVWANLEAAVRELASRRGELFVITGPVFTPTARKIGNGVWVPYALFKVIVDKNRNEMTAFIIPNLDGQGDDPARFQVSVREVERASGLNFNPELSRADADKMEVNGGNWIIPKVRVRFKE